MKKCIILGSRGSELALTQSKQVAEWIRRAVPDIEVRIEIFTSKGDKIQNIPLAKIGGKGLFTKELETALLDGSIDFAVHSLKDLPTELPEGLCVGAVPVRENPCDALVSRAGHTLANLPRGARVGTSSLRRKSQLLALRPDFEIVDLRGNVPTRVRKMTEQGLDAIILASAGLHRLGMAEVITELIPPETMLSAVGQGALGIEIRGDDDDMRAILSHLHHEETALEVTAERALLAGLGGGCQVPIGARARIDGNELVLNACVCAPDGSQVLRQCVRGPRAEAADLGQTAAKTLQRDGALRLMVLAEHLEGPVPKPLAGVRIVITRARGQVGDFAEDLERLGADVVEFPTIRVKDLTPREEVDASYDWLVFTSVNGVEAFARWLEGRDKSFGDFGDASVCAIGSATARALLDRGVPVALTPDRFVAESLLEVLEQLEGCLPGKRFLMPRGNLARPLVPDALRARGAEVTELTVYETVPAEITPDAVKALLASTPDLVTFTSTSTARNFRECFDAAQMAQLREHAIFASIGPITSESARELGMDITIEPGQHDIPALVHAIATYYRDKKRSTD